ncbi:hypothetical protein HPB49_026306 [Dermacentor silvarum]|nr:hypothetical protein HPB49_026306 [Dermacentor silvarum]
MAASAWRGYDPETMTWSEIVAEAPSSLEPSTPKEEIVDEGLFSLVALRKRQQRPNASVVNGLSISAGVSVPPNTARSNPQLSQAAGSKKWRPTAMPRLRKEDFTIVIKPRVTISLKTALQNGELGALLSAYVNPSSADILSVWPIWDQNIVIATTQDVMRRTRSLVNLHLMLPKAPSRWSDTPKSTVKCAGGLLRSMSRKLLPP